MSRETSLPAGLCMLRAESHLWFCSGVGVSYSVGSFGGTSYLIKIIQKFFLDSLLPGVSPPWSVCPRLPPSALLSLLSAASFLTISRRTKLECGFSPVAPSELWRASQSRSSVVSPLLERVSRGWWCSSMSPVPNLVSVSVISVSKGMNELGNLPAGIPSPRPGWSRGEHVKMVRMKFQLSLPNHYNIPCDSRCLLIPDATFWDFSQLWP